MTSLPIKQMTLYKHGIGYYERRAILAGDTATLSFHVDDMNDILKSLTVIDWGEGQVLGIDYATPQSRAERLAGNTIRLRDRHSLQDLLVGLRGRRVSLTLSGGRLLNGVLVGLDEAPAEQPLATTLVSVLAAESPRVESVTLDTIEGVDILDERGEQDLRFFLETALGQDDFRQVTIRLTPGGHDLSVSYIAPAPTWRVSYRLVLDEAAVTDGETPLLLQGWGIFDNRLEEDLQDVSLALVAGMPISFVYDLYTPFTPDRPVVSEEARVAAGPIDFAGAVADMEMEEATFGMAAPAPQMAKLAAPAGRAQGRARERLAESAPAAASGKAMGELFQYEIQTPVSVSRGQSAMVPIVAATLKARKELLYNGRKLPTHPVASLRLLNESGLTLERGPVTVLEAGAYVGEAVLPFSAVDAEMVVAYSVELGVKVREDQSNKRELHRLQLQGAYLRFEEWDIQQRMYQLNNDTNRDLTILVEHPRRAAYELHETEKPKEQTDGEYRFAVAVAGGREAKLTVQERRLVARREELSRQSYAGLARYLRAGLLSRDAHDFITTLLGLWEKVNEHERKLAEVAATRERIYKQQKQIQGNMGALTSQGDEGRLRARYVEQLGASEEQLVALAEQEEALKAAKAELEAEIQQRLESAP